MRRSSAPCRRRKIALRLHPHGAAASASSSCATWHAFRDVVLGTSISPSARERVASSARTAPARACSLRMCRRARTHRGRGLGRPRFGTGDQAHVSISATGIDPAGHGPARPRCSRRVRRVLRSSSFPYEQCGGRTTSLGGSARGCSCCPNAARPILLVLDEPTNTSTSTRSGARSCPGSSTEPSASSLTTVLLDRIVDGSSRSRRRARAYDGACRTGRAVADALCSRNPGIASRVRFINRG